MASSGCLAEEWLNAGRRLQAAFRHAFEADRSAAKMLRQTFLQLYGGLACGGPELILAIATETLVEGSSVREFSREALAAALADAGVELLPAIGGLVLERAPGLAFTAICEDWSEPLLEDATWKAIIALRDVRERPQPLLKAA